MRYRLLLVFTAMVIVLAACGGQATETNQTEETLKDVTVVLDWTPNTNHTGLYAAKAEGYFEEEGINVTIVQPGEAGANQMVAAGNAEFGISAQEGVTQARLQDVPVVSIGAIIQHNTSVLASPEEKNITTPKDLEGKTYGGWGSPIEKATIASIMKKDQANIDKLNIVNMGNTDFFTAVKKDIDVAWIYYGWTGVEAELRDVPLNVISFTDYSEKLDYYTPVLITSEQQIAQDPETVQAFMNAATEGYQYAMAHPEDAAQMLLEAAPDLDEELVVASQKWLSDKYQADADRWGEQKKTVWENYMNWMYENELIDDTIDVEQAFTNDFLPDRAEE